MNTNQTQSCDKVLRNSKYALKIGEFHFFQTSYGLRWMSAEEREVNKQTISAVTLRSEESQYFEEKCICLQPHNCWDLYEI